MLDNQAIATKDCRRPALRYHGGKWNLAPWIISNFPVHRIYTEVYGGGASVLIRKPRCYSEVYNDLDSEVVNVFKVYRDHGEQLVNKVWSTPVLAHRICRNLRARCGPYRASQANHRALIYGVRKCRCYKDQKDHKEILQPRNRISRECRSVRNNAGAGNAGCSECKQHSAPKDIEEAKRFFYAQIQNLLIVAKQANWVSENNPTGDGIEAGHKRISNAVEQIWNTVSALDRIVTK